MKDFLLQAWQARGWRSHLLMPLAWVYCILLRLRLWAYRHGFLASSRFDAVVLVVGNAMVGGAGKTPLVMALVKHVQSQGWQVGVVSRGYGRSVNASSPHSSLEVKPDTPLSVSGDEPALIRQTTGVPVFVATRRTQAVRDLLAAYPGTQIVICDDGLQHAALQRDLEVVVFDQRGVGNGRLLPAGPLREPWPGQRATRRTDNPSARISKGSAKTPANPPFLVLHTAQPAAFAGYSSCRSLASHARRANGDTVDLRALAGQPLVALAGIANPGAFFSMLTASGLQLSRTLAFDDHHSFTLQDLQPLRGHTVLCTEKDAVKLFALLHGQGTAPLDDALKVDVWAVPLVFTPEPAFFEALDAELTPLLAARFSPLPLPHGHQTT